MMAYGRLLVFIIAVLVWAGGLTGIAPAQGAVPGAAQQKETVKVGFFNFDGYHNEDNNGVKSGYGYEFLQLVNRYNDWNYEYIGYDKSWQEMQQMLESGAIDVLTSAQKTPEREAKFLFSAKPIGNSSTVLTIRAGEKSIISGEYSTYNGMRVGMLRNNSRNDSFRRFAAAKGFTYTEVYYDNTLALENALQQNVEINATVSSNLRLTQNEWILDQFDTSPFYAMVRRERPDIMRRIDYAMDQMEIYTPSWRTDLFGKYYSSFNSAALTLSKAENDYLHGLKVNNIILMVLMNPDRAPYSYFEGGQPKGISYRVFKEIAERMGIKYKLVQARDRDEYMRLLKSGTIDINLDALFDYYVAERDGYCLTEPYLTTAVAKITSKLTANRATTEDDQNKIVAQLENFSVAPKTAVALYGFNHLKKCKTIDACLESVLDGSATETYLYAYTAQQELAKAQYNDLIMTILPQYTINLSIAVSNNCDHRLQSIMDKAVRTLSSPVLQNIIVEETSVATGQVTLTSLIRSNPVIAIGLALLLSTLIFGLFYMWQREKASAREKQQAEELARFVGYTCRANDAVLELDFVKRQCSQLQVQDGVITYEPYDFQFFDYKVNPDNIIFPEDFPAVSKALAPENLKYLLEHGSGDDYVEIRVKDAKGSYHWLSYKLQPLAVDAEKPCSFILFKKDIDGVKRAEEAKNRALKDALENAHRASEAKGTFLSRMSHEIRTPLNAVIGYLSIAKTSSDDPNKLMHCIDNSEIASKHLLSIINDVLDMSSIERGKMKIANESFDLKSLITNVSTIFYNQAQNKGVIFETVIEGLTEEWVKGDQLRLNQVLVNLLGNAVKFTPQGGRITLGVKQITLTDKTVHLCFTVADNGIGMNAEFKERLFKPFEQESAGTAQKYGGTGLGLSITKNLITMMKGTIDVTSELGKGSTFNIMMSFDKSEENEKLHNTSHDFSSIRALVVDDEKNECDYIKALLKRCGVKANVVTSGEEAIKQIRRRIGTEQYYDLCIFDWNMPDLNGVETAKRIHQEFDAHLPIIIATAYDTTAFETEARAAGVAKVISKPLFQSTMFDLLVSTFGKYQPKGAVEAKDLNLKGIKLILAEDNAMNMEIAVEILQKAGVEIEQATNGKEAVDKFNAAKPGEYQAILMDIQMPIMNGYEATKAIRAGEHPEAKTIPIIAMTANAFTEDVTEALAAGMNAHISKPIDYNKLFEVLQKCFKK